MFAGIDLQGDSPNLAPISSPAFVKCKLSLDVGVPIGTVESTQISPDFAQHTITTVLGNLNLVVNNDTGAIRKENLIDPQTAQQTDISKAFPDAPSYFLPDDQNPAHYQIWTASGNIYKDKVLQTVGSSWVGTGLFKNINFLQLRCVYLVRISSDYAFGFRVIRCLGCNYFLDIK